MKTQRKRKIFWVLWIIISLLLSNESSISVMAGKKVVSLNYTKMVLKVGKTFRLKVKEKTGVTIKKVQFSTNSTKIKLTQKGKVTGIRKGTAKVKCKIWYRNRTNKLKKNVLVCKVKVKKEENKTTELPVELPTATSIGTPVPTSTVATNQITAKPVVPRVTPTISQQGSLSIEDLDENKIKQELDVKTMINESLDENWKFSKIGFSEEDIQGAVSELCNEQGYETVSLPHTWNAEDGADGWEATDADGNSYYRGNGVYRKEISLDQEIWGGKRIFLSFEGANTIATLYMNGEKVGSHENGYSGFRFEITDYILWNQTNVLAVVVNNSRTTYIAPLDWEGDFTKFGGIYRNVSLTGVEELSIDKTQNGTEGVYVSTELTEDFSVGTAKVRVLLKNMNQDEKEVKLISVCRDAKGNEVARKGVSSSINGLSCGEAVYQIELENPHLWQGVKNPYLYTVETFLVQDDKVVETVSTEIGFRQYEIIDNQFYLNGEVYEIYGVNYHQDSEEHGWAMTDEERDRDYEIMKEMGVTAVRMAHYQHDPYEYRLCDRMGFVVYTEIPLINRSTSDDFVVDWTKFSENIKMQLTELILQNYNHPSICFWGISNELYDVDDATCELYTELCELAKSLDSTRKTIYADNQAWPDYVKRSQAADFVGYNRYDGWYYGVLGGSSEWIADKQKGDGRPSCLSEYGAGGAVTQHMDMPIMKDINANGKWHYEEYQSIYHEKAWEDIVSAENIWGSFIWCMYDFASDSREEGDTKGQNDKGIVTRDRKIKKDAFYFYKSVWTQEPMVHITSSRFVERAYQIPEVKVYSNAEQVELYVNGNLIGYGNRDTEEGKKTIFRWSDVLLEKNSSNTVEAVAYFEDGSKKTDVVEWTGVE